MVSVLSITFQNELDMKSIWTPCPSPSLLRLSWNICQAAQAMTWQVTTWPLVPWGWLWVMRERAILTSNVETIRTGMLLHLEEHRNFAICSSLERKCIIIYDYFCVVANFNQFKMFVIWLSLIRRYDTKIRDKHRHSDLYALYCICRLGW